MKKDFDEAQKRFLTGLEMVTEFGTATFIPGICLFYQMSIVKIIFLLSFSEFDDTVYILRTAGSHEQVWRVGGFETKSS